MEEFKINSTLSPGKYISEKGIEIEFKELYNGNYWLNIGSNISIECRTKKIVIDKIKKLAKFLKKS